MSYLTTISPCFLFFPIQFTSMLPTFLPVNETLLKVLNVLNFILLFTYFLQPERTDCGVVLDITSAHYRLSE